MVCKVYKHANKTTKLQGNYATWDSSGTFCHSSIWQKEYKRRSRHLYNNAVGCQIKAKTTLLLLQINFGHEHDIWTRSPRIHLLWQAQEIGKYATPFPISNPKYRDIGHAWKARSTCVNCTCNFVTQDSEFSCPRIIWNNNRPATFNYIYIKSLSVADSEATGLQVPLLLLLSSL